MKKRILLLGSFGQRNLGDELLYESYLDLIGDKYIIYSNSSSPKKLKKNKNIEQFNTSFRYDIVKKITALLFSDFYIFGGGSIVLEFISSSKGKKNISRRPLFLLILIEFFAKVFKKKVILANVGVGPFYSDIGRMLARLALSNAYYVSVRDKYSFLLSKKISSRNDIVYSGDAVLYGKKSSFDKRRKKVKRIVLIPNWYILPSSEKLRQQNLKNLKILVKELVKKRLNIVLMPFRVDYGDFDDYWMSKEIYYSLSKVEKKYVNLLKTSDYGVIKGEIKNAHLVITQRLHGAIVASLFNKDIITINNDPKLINFIEELGVGKVFDSDFSPEIIVKNIEVLHSTDKAENGVKRIQQRIDTDFENISQIIYS